MKRTLLKILPAAIFLIFAFWILAVKNAYVLRWYDEMSLFEPGLDSLRQFLHYPGGVFRFVGTFLTQLLYYPALGAGVLILLWLFDAWLFKVSFNISAGMRTFCYLIPFCLLASVLHFDEACFTFEAQGYVFYNTLGFTFSLGAYCLYSVYDKYSYARIAIPIILSLLYPIAGFFSLLPAVMCVIDICINSKKYKIIPSSVSAVSTLILVIIIPLIYYRYFTGTTVDNDYLYLKGLPELTMEGYDWYLWSPFVFASIIMLISSVLRPFTNITRLNSSKILICLGIVLYGLGIVFNFKADNKKSEQFRATVLMTEAIEKKDWNKILHIMSLTKESPNYTMCVLENLARAYSGRGQRDLGNMTAGFTDPRHDERYTITGFVYVPVNHHMGRFNQSHRWATEHVVQYGNKAYFIKYIVLNAIMNGDMKFAKKFNNLLMRTMFHRRWAEDMQKYIDNPSLVKTMPDYDFLMALRAEEMMRGE